MDTEYHPGQTLGVHPNGHTLAVYYQNGQPHTALYAHGALIKPHPDYGWGYQDRNGFTVRLPANMLAELQEIAPTTSMPPLIDDQQGLVKPVEIVLPDERPKPRLPPPPPASFVPPANWDRLLADALTPIGGPCLGCDSTGQQTDIDGNQFPCPDCHPEAHQAPPAVTNGAQAPPATPKPHTAPQAPKPEAEGELVRRLRLTPADTFTIRPVKWLWDGRIPLGSLTLLGGREGIGKSTCAYTLAADITRGRLPGVYHHQPKPVIVAATEDSWEHTIAPRLIAADADLAMVYRVDVVDGLIVTELSLPADLAALDEQTRALGAALILLDPLMSRLAAVLDTHKDGEVRQALEPLVRLADRCQAAIIGIIHVNKTGGTDALNTIMASKAFVAVARAVLFAVTDPDHDGQRLLGQAKNNLGRADLPTLTYTITGVVVADTPEGPVWAGRLTWGTETTTTITEALENSGHDQSTRQECEAWLIDYLDTQGGCELSATVKKAARREGYTDDVLRRARQHLGLVVEHRGFPRQTVWTNPTR